MKKSKPSAGRGKRPQRMTKEELIATLLKKKQCNARALSIVEGMLEGEVNTHWLLESLQFITQSHYQDAVEERSIMKMCGYPLCRSPLINIPKQQFRISTQNNKVYDISERKNFCSNACYRSSTFLKDQILTSPLWLRDIEKVPVFRLLDGNSKRGGVGDEIDVGPTRVTVEEASIAHGTLSESGEGSEKEDDIKTQLRKIEESNQNVSVEKILSENSATPTQNECDIPIVEENKISVTSVSFEDSKLVCTLSEPVEKTLPNREEPGTIDTQKRNIKKLESSLSEEFGSAIDLNNEPSSSGILDIIVQAVEKDDSARQNAVLRKTACDSNSSKSEERLTHSIDGKSSTSNAESSDLKSTEKRAEKRDFKNVEESKEKSAEDSKQTEKTVDTETKVRKQKRTSRDANTKVLPVAMPSISEFVEERLMEWFTVDSLCFLYGEQRTREMLGKLGGDLEQNFKPLDSATWDPEKHDRFVNICKRLNLLDLEDRSYDEKVINEDKNVVKKPLPDFNKLKEEAEKMDLRVQAFYKGQLDLEPRKVTFAEDTKEEAEDSEMPVIPLVHQHEQRALRRRLVLDSLNRFLPDLLRTIGVHSSQVNSSLRGLIGTFALTASNITFNPRQWTLVAIAIIKLLSVKEAPLHRALESEASMKYLTLIQMSYNLSPTFLDLLLDRLIPSAIAPPKPAETS